MRVEINKRQFLQKVRSWWRNQICVYKDEGFAMNKDRPNCVSLLFIVQHRTPDKAISEARQLQYVDVRGECLSIFFIASCEISLQAHFSAVADTWMYVPYYNTLSAKIYSSYVKPN